jgi:uncharacterized protein YheU (UPF0270 family)
MTAIKIPYDQLSPEALQGVVEEFVTRDGTDYGEVEVPLETKIAQVMNQLKSGKAVIRNQAYIPGQNESPLTAKACKRVLWKKDHLQE